MPIHISYGNVSFFTVKNLSRKRLYTLFVFFDLVYFAGQYFAILCLHLGKESSLNICWRTISILLSPSTYIFQDNALESDQTYHTLKLHCGNFVLEQFVKVCLIIQHNCFVAPVGLFMNGRIFTQNKPLT